MTDLGKNNMFKRIMAFALAILMVFTLIPMNTYIVQAEDGDGGAGIVLPTEYNFTITDELGAAFVDATVSIYAPDASDADPAIATKVTVAGDGGNVLMFALSDLSGDSSVTSFEGYTYKITADGYCEVSGEFGAEAAINISMVSLRGMNGMIVDGTSAPMKGVTVQLLQGENVIGTTVSDETGAFVFDVVADGDYILKLISADYKTQTIDIIGFVGVEGVYTGFDASVSSTVSLVEEKEDVTLTISHDGADESIEERETLNLTTIFQPEITDYVVVYTSNDNRIATVTDTGVVTGVSTGVATITATLTHDTYKCTPATIDINVTPYNDKAILTGTVKLPSGAYTCPGAAVYLLAEDVDLDTFDLSTVTPVTTDDNGVYTFTNAIIGNNYRLLVKNDYYISELSEVVSITGNDGDTITKDLTAKRIVKLKFSESTLNLHINEAFTQNQFIPSPPGGADIVGYVFSSDAQNIVAVDSNTGVITLAGDEGTATITVDIVDKTDYVVLDYSTASYSVVVSKISNPNINFTSEDLRVNSVTKYFSIEKFDSSVNYLGTEVVTYESSDEDVAVIGPDGKIEMKDLGTTTITATIPADGGYAETVCTYELVVAQRTQTDLAWADASLNGTTEQTKTVTYGVTGEFVADVIGIIDNLGGTYASTNQNVATVDANGNVTIVGLGSTTITYTSPDNGDNRYEIKTLSFKLDVQVGAQPIIWENNLVNGGTISKTFGDEKFTIGVIVGEDNGDKTGLAGVFESDDTSVATVDPATGEVTIVAVGDGSATITYTSTDSKGYYNTEILTYTVVVDRADQTGFVWKNGSSDKEIVFDEGVTYMNATETANEGVQATYSSSDTNIATVDSAGVVTALKAGEVVITASISQTANYHAKTISYKLNIEKGTQTISFGAPNYSFVNGAVFTSPVATSDEPTANGAYTYSFENGENNIATIDANTGVLSFTLQAGEVIVKVVRAADDKYKAAEARYTLTVLEWDPLASGISSTYYLMSGVKTDESTSWYTKADANNPISLVAANGYQLYKGTTDPTPSTVWSSSINVSDIHDGADNTIVYYIKEVASGQISKQYTLNNIKVDTTSPNAAIVVDEATVWEKILSFFTFDLIGQDVPELKITTSDATSGVKEVYYYISNSLDPLEKNGLVDSVALEKEATWKTYTNVVDLLDEKVTENVIYTKVIDKAGNITYASTNGLIFDGVKPIVTPTVITDDVNGIYNGDVEINLDVVDAAPYSGVQEITYVVENAGVVTDKGTLFTFQPLVAGNPKQSELISTWNSASFGKNLIVKASDNNSDNVKVTFTVIDNAGNTTESVVDLKIDITAPVINVSYDNNNGDTTFADGVYYNADRTATITVSERHFDASKVKLTITNSDGTIPTLSGWTKTSDGSGNGDNITHTATVTFSADGDYTFDVSCTDKAANVSGAVNYGESQAPTSFTIDKTIPTITISYDNNDVLNDNYYKADRVATVVIQEHNFDSSRVNTIITATDDGQAVTAPVISGWSTSGDTHTATISYSSDALYTFDIEYSDKAGNAIADVAEQSFYVDKTMPSVSITEIVDQSANNEETIGFVITATDTNFDVFTPVLTAVVQTENGFTTTELNIGSISEITNGQIYTVENLETDGIYSITCTAIDKAGNAYTEVSLQRADGSTYVENRAGEDTLIMFSVNRLGSTFAVDENTQGVLENEYVQNVENDVVVYEVNTNELVSYSVSLNGSELSEGSDYSVSNTGGNGEWMRYTYTVNKELFEAEGEYVLVVSSTDGAENNAFSDVKDANISFVVDRTAPIVTVTGMESNRSYQTERQTVTLMPTDDGGLLETLLVRLVDRDGNVINELINLSGDELRDSLDTNGGTITFDLTEGLNQSVQIVCGDKAYDANGLANTFDQTYENVSVSASAIAIFFAGNTVYYIAGGAAGVAGLGVAISVLLKKRKMPKAK